jgi:type IV pilus assembly protein PilA
MSMQSPYAPPAPPKKTNTCLIVAIVLVVIAVPLVGTVAALGIYGVRRYLAAAKTAEAKNTVGAISRAAVSAYEYETVAGASSHRLCASAITVPSRVPAGNKYQPSSAAGADFDSGSTTAGWRCLKFTMSYPMYYQYQYHQGSGYVVPGAGSPGPNGFEVAAFGDLNGDGVKSTFARTGQVVGGSVALSTTLFIENEFE